MALSHVKTPLASRIERWATGTTVQPPHGGPKTILLHPADYKIVSSAKAREKLERMYNLEVRCLGGEEALKKHIRDENGSKEENTDEG